MDPVNVILSALVAGGTAALKDSASNAVKDAYAGLKALIQNRIAKAKKPEAEMVLANFEKDPTTWEKPLQKSLTESRIGSDTEILEGARRVLQLVQPQQYAHGKYNVQVTGKVQGQVVGDHAHQENQFGGPSES